MVRLQEALKVRALANLKGAAEGYKRSRREAVLDGLSRLPSRGGDDQLRRLNWALAAYARSSAALIRFSSFKELVAGVCEAIVGDDEYLLATAGLIEDGPGAPIRLIAGAGRASRYMDDLHLSWSAAYAEGLGPAGRAIRSGQPLIMQDAYDEPAFALWRQKALSFGIRSSVTVPFSRDGRPVGMLKVYAGRPNAFGAQELDVFSRLGRELAFALSVEDGRASLRAAEAARRAAEASARESLAELARAARALSVGAFAASIAHEVNQPVSAIVANSEAAQHWLAMKPPNLEEADAALKRIIRDAERASSVVSRTRGMLSKDLGERQWVDPCPLLRDTLMFTESQRDRRHVTVEADLADGLPPVWADPIQVQQVVLNLIANAIDAMSDIDPGRRLLRVEARPLAGNRIQISVADTGVGVAALDAGRLFDLLFTTKPDGVGLGLPISKAIIEAHGGEIRMEPNDPCGTVFSFTLPTVQAA